MIVLLNAGLAMGFCWAGKQESDGALNEKNQQTTNRMNPSTDAGKMLNNLCGGAKKQHTKMEISSSSWPDNVHGKL